jgi:hypothetical protein
LKNFPRPEQGVDLLQREDGVEVANVSFLEMMQASLQHHSAYFTLFFHDIFQHRN